MDALETTQWVFGAALCLYILFKLAPAAKALFDPDHGRLHCMTCGVEDAPTKARSIPWGAVMTVWVIALALAIAVSWPWIVLGLFVHIASDASRKDVCQICGARTLIPPSSPAAVAHKKTLAQ